MLCTIAIFGIFSQLFACGLPMWVLSIITPKSFVEDVLLIEFIAIFRSGDLNGMWSFAGFLWNKVYLAFFRLILPSSIFAAINCYDVVTRKKRFVSLGNMMVYKNFEMCGRSFT